ncbi:MAG: hypothetical protein ACRD5F_12985 [Candidatus Acidiferrales bacterium]
MKEDPRVSFLASPALREAMTGVPCSAAGGYDGSGAIGASGAAQKGRPRVRRPRSADAPQTPRSARGAHVALECAS